MTCMLYDIIFLVTAWSFIVFSVTVIAEDFARETFEIFAT